MRSPGRSGRSERSPARRREPDVPLGSLLSRAHRWSSREIQRRLAALGYVDVRAGHGAVFGRLDVAGATVAELARRADMTKQAMGELVDDLERKGYVRRSPDPRDARARLVRPTRRGERHIADARRVMAELERELERRVGPRRLAALRETLRTLADLDEEGAPSRATEIGPNGPSVGDFRQRRGRASSSDSAPHA